METITENHHQSKCRGVEPNPSGEGRQTVGTRGHRVCCGVVSPRNVRSYAQSLTHVTAWELDKDASNGHDKEDWKSPGPQPYTENHRQLRDAKRNSLISNCSSNTKASALRTYVWITFYRLRLLQWGIHTHTHAHNVCVTTVNEKETVNWKIIWQVHRRVWQEEREERNDILTSKCKEKWNNTKFSLQMSIIK